MPDPPGQRPVDPELLGRVLDEHGAALALYAAQWTDAADDCVQEALVELARQPAQPEHLLAWLYRVVKHRALNTTRGARRRRERESRAMAERFEMTSTRSFDRGDSLAVVEAVERLSEDAREIVVMRIWGGLTYEEIATAMGTSIASAHRQYERALVILRDILESPCSTNENRSNLN
jgi:RNA polymerase sigma-70 factor (ECF subfamily)